MKVFFIFTLAGLLFLSIGTTLLGENELPEGTKAEKEKVIKWREERDQFFKTHQRSPLVPAQ